MDIRFKRTFDCVKMNSRRQEELRSELSSRLSGSSKEDNNMDGKKIPVRKYRVLAVALIAMFSLTLVGFAYRNQIVDLLTGGSVERGRTSDGYDFVSVTSGVEDEPAKVENGKIIFTLDGIEKDITDQCSDTKYYKYESIDQQGWKHVVVIGGTPDGLGIVEYTWDEDGMFVASSASYPEGESQHTPEWQKNAELDLGVLQPE